MGQYLIWGRFVVDARRRTRTIYGLTDSRAVILVQGRFERFTSVDLGVPRDVEYVDGRHGLGTLRFGSTPVWSNWTSPTWPGSRLPPSFEHVRNARAVYAKMMEVLKRRR